MKIKPLLCLIALLLCNCSQKAHKIESPDVPVYKVDITTINELDLTQISDFCHLVPLETKDESLIGVIEKVFLIDSLILVWDSKMHTLLLFNERGDFKYQIGVRGEGPEEYIEISEVNITPEKNIQILDSRLSHIHTFNLKGECIRRERFPDSICSFTTVKDGIWGVSSFWGDESHYLLHFSSVTKEIDYGYFPNKAFFSLRRTNHFAQNEKTKELLFYYSYDDIIYEINENELIPFISINFENKKAPYNYDKSEKLEDKLFTEEYLGHIHNLFIYGKHLFFSFYKSKAGTEYHYSIYDAYVSNDTQEILVYNSKIKHAEELTIKPDPKIMNVSDGKLIFQIEPDILSFDLLTQLNEMLPYNPVTYGSNPILVIYDLKDIEE